MTMHHGRVWPLCKAMQYKVEIPPITTDVEQVTCKRCLEMLTKRVERTLLNDGLVHYGGRGGISGGVISGPWCGIPDIGQSVVNDVLKVTCVPCIDAWQRNQMLSNHKLTHR